MRSILALIIVGTVFGRIAVGVDVPGDIVLAALATAGAYGLARRG